MSIFKDRQINMERQQKQARDLHLSVYIYTLILIHALKYKLAKKAL